MKAPKAGIARYTITLAMLGVLSGTYGASAQTAGQVMREARHLDDLIESGRYVEGTKLAETLLGQLRDWRHPDFTTLFLPYVAKLSVETGKMEQASGILDSAEALSSKYPDYNYNKPVLLRERAAFYYASGRYDDAVKAAAKAYGLSQEHNYFALRAKYCQSIQALALLRMGHTAEAEEFATDALKSVPKKVNEQRFFASRILYSACLVETHRGNLADAEGLCRRGLQIATDSKKESRDLSLGYLALAEFHLQSGDLVHSREAALESIGQTKRLFGTQHQDMVDALDLLGTISLRQGDAGTARTQFEEALKIATRLFGDGSAGASMPARALHDMGPTGPGIQQ